MDWEHGMLRYEDLLLSTMSTLSFITYTMKESVGGDERISYGSLFPYTKGIRYPVHDVLYGMALPYDLSTLLRSGTVGTG